MRWHDGRQASFLSDNSAGSRREDYLFHGIERTCTVSTEGLRIETPYDVRHIASTRDGDGFAAEHRAFLDAVHG